MDDLFLKTKLLVPPLRSQLVPRPRLDALLRRALDLPLTLVSAPAGFGKTTATLVAARALQAGTGIMLAWLALDAHDDLPARFWRYLVASLHPVVPTAGAEVAAALALPQPPPIQPLLITLLNALTDHAAPLLLVLDDYHAISQAEIHAGLAFLLEHAPPNLHLVLITRADPPLPLHRWRARGQLLDLRADLLRFDQTEAVALLTGAMDLALSDAEVARLVAQTEGWAAGLHLAGLALQGAPPGQRDLVARLSQSTRYIADYLTEEVLAQQPAPVQAFLLQTSILDRLCGTLCDVVTGQHGGQEVLETLTRRNLFVTRIDSPDSVGGGGWYRYHPLFAELLQGQLRVRQPELLPTLHRRAAGWHVASGLVEPAIEHALAGEDDAQASDLIERHASGIVMAGQTLTIEPWLQRLPEAWRRRLPRANLALAWSLLLRGHSGEFVPYLERATAALTAEDHALWGEVHALRATLAESQGQTDQALAYARQALDAISPDNLFAQAMVRTSFASTLRSRGAVGEAIAAYEQAVPLCRAAGLLLPQMLGHTHLAHLYLLQGRLHQAEAATRPAVAAARHHPVASLPLLPRAMVLLEWDRLEETEELLQQAMALGRAGGIHTVLTRGETVLARLRRAQGDPAAAQALLDAAAARLPHEAPTWVEALLIAEQVQLWLAQGALDAAEHLLARRGAAVDAAAGHERDLLPLTWARLRHRQGKLAEARALVDVVLAAAVANGRQGRMIEALLLRAQLHMAAGAMPPAQADIQRALEIAAPEGYLRSFLDAGTVVATLLRRMKDEGGGMKPYIAELLAAYGQMTPSAPDPQPSALSPQRLAEPLTERELEVLRLLARGLTYQQIADALVVSLNTVRHHVKGLYGKLQVAGRMQALARAQALDLL